MSAESQRQRTTDDDQQLEHVSILGWRGAKINSDEFWRGSGHEGRVVGALVLPDERVLSWGVDRSIRIRKIRAESSELSFYLDARPTVVVSIDPNRLLAGDVLGRVHCLEILSAAL